MRNVVIAMLAVGALAALGCEDKKPDAKPSTSTSMPAATATAKPAAAPAKTAAPGGGW
jgi:hypothetical protein